jgi:hypothetical protein
VLRCFIKIYFQFSSRCAVSSKSVSNFLRAALLHQNLFSIFFALCRTRGKSFWFSTRQASATK